MTMPCVWKQQKKDCYISNGSVNIVGISKRNNRRQSPINIFLLREHRVDHDSRIKLPGHLVKGTPRPPCTMLEETEQRLSTSYAVKLEEPRSDLRQNRSINCPHCIL